MASISYPARFLATSGTLSKVISHLLEVPPKSFLLSSWGEGTQMEGLEMAGGSGHHG